jgi:inosine-uridine nucleoside N-ribohydrolase
VTPTRIILDVDTGTDDAVALMVAALSPDIELVGATAVNGNTGVDDTTENTLRVLDLVGRPDIPVLRGMATPMLRPQGDRGMAAVIHRTLLDLPPARTQARPEHAVDWLCDTYMASEGDITLVAVGPLTNVAMALLKEPRMTERIPEIVIMGGAHESGNRTASAEYNFWVDPEAARVVVECGRPIRMVPLDATHRAPVSLDDCARLRALGTAAGNASAAIVEQRIHGYNATQPMAGASAAPVHDALAVCAVIEPAVLSTRLIRVDVETTSTLAAGRTICDVRPAPEGIPNVEFAFDADGSRFVEMLVEILGRSAPVLVDAGVLRP